MAKITSDTKLSTTITVGQLSDLTLVAEGCRALMCPVKYKKVGRELEQAIKSIEQIGSEWRTK